MKNRTCSFAVLIALLFACNKENKPISISATISQDAQLACVTALSDAENIAIFPADNSWNQDISGKAVDAYSTNIINSFSASPVKADFGSGNYQGAPIGIPYVVVCGSQQKYSVTFRANNYDGNYGNESDKGPYAIPLTAPIEGNGNGDSHVIAVDKDSSILYELYNASVNGDHWEASSGAIYNLNSNALRKKGWTSADAAGLPIFAGLVRYEEILRDTIDHAIRFTLSSSNVYPGFVKPSRHKVNSTGVLNASLPFGARIRLKANYDISTFSPYSQVILRAMKKYGLMLADIGSNMYISGAPDARWDNDELRELLRVTATNFEVVKFPR